MKIEHNGIKYYFFWNGIFSNWHHSPFIYKGKPFNSGEQFMMFTKAIVFNDFDTAKQIMETSLPRKQKSLGRKVKNFDSKIWDSVKYRLIKNGLTEKFNQNPDIKEYLIKQKDCIIVEASPFDKIWGIGFEEDDAIENINNWGENLLGKILTELANEL